MPQFDSIFNDNNIATTKSLFALDRYTPDPHNRERGKKLPKDGQDTTPEILINPIHNFVELKNESNILAVSGISSFHKEKSEIFKEDLSVSQEGFKAHEEQFDSKNYLAPGDNLTEVISFVIIWIRLLIDFFRKV